MITSSLIVCPFSKNQRKMDSQQSPLAIGTVGVFFTKERKLELLILKFLENSIA
jgi:hypothetical protein